MADEKISNLTSLTTPEDDDDYVTVDVSDTTQADSGTTKKITWASIKAAMKTYFDTLYGTSGSGAGWIPLGTATYEGADDPTYTFSFASDMTGILSAGMKIKLTQATGGTKYCFITAVGSYSGGKTIITGYFGTDYDLANEAILNSYYSIQKAPFGFPLDPTKWTVETTDTSSRSQSTPTQNVWYNLGSITISIPIGVWDVMYEVCVQSQDNTVDTKTVYVTLSTSNNSESDADMTTMQYVSSSGSSLTTLYTTQFRRKILSVTTKTSYYLNARTTDAGVDSIAFQNSFSKCIVRAICSYL